MLGKPHRADWLSKRDVTFSFLPMHLTFKKVNVRIMSVKAFITGVTGLEPSQEELSFFRKENPWGFILFARNIDNPDQVSRLTKALRTSVGRDDAPVLLDQEGGRVQRLRPPHWTNYPAASALGALYDLDRVKGERATWLLSRLHAFDLLPLGITVDCLPVLDVPTPDENGVIGDRAYSSVMETISALGGVACNGLLAGGVKPVVKHIPGHGRATADTHFDLPVVDTDWDTLAATDFKPFADLSHIDMAMTAHVVYSAIDAHQPATTSKAVVDQVIRDHIGFDGLLMCDDIDMKALSGDLAERTHAIVAAGCDMVLHCNGTLEERKIVAQNTPVLEGKALERARTALVGIGNVDQSDEAACRVEFDALMSVGLMAASDRQQADPTNYGKTA